MQKLADALQTAEQAAIISAEQRERLADHFRASGLLASEAAVGARFLGELGAPRDSEPVTATEESEAPRFIRGFHDVLITIGIVVLLGGLSAFVPHFIMILPVIVLAEILVKRQRLALPAFVLTIAAVMFIPSALAPVFGSAVTSPAGDSPVLVFATLFAGLAAFYWRYRVPVALAAMIIAAGALAFFLILNVLGLTPADGAESFGPAMSAIAFAFAAGLFAVALWFDMRDPARVTRRSDVAFWLHLAAAPALLYSTLMLLSELTGGGLSIGAFVEASPLAAILPILILMLVGIVIDRRAFVTSGLLSLGIAIGVLMKNTQIEFSSTASLAAVAVGVIVLALGIGWIPLRKLIVRPLPEGLRARVPAVQ